MSIKDKSRMRVLKDAEVLLLISLFVVTGIQKNCNHENLVSFFVPDVRNMVPGIVFRT